MNIINKLNIGEELKRWFSKSIFNFNEINFNDILTFESVLNDFHHDYIRYFKNDKITFDNIISRRELQGIFLYRIARHYYLNNNEIVAGLYSNLGSFLSGFEIYYSSSIGKGIKINHGIGTVIGARTEIGENCLLHHNITLGDKNGGRPSLLDDVTVYPGAKILGNIIIGNNSIIGANCVCAINVPDDYIAVGIPARLIKKQK
jgi:serine O-acetyltransferase